MPFSKIFLTVLFDTLTNNVSFLFLILHLFKCVALLCIYIFVIIILLIYMWGFNSIIRARVAQWVRWIRWLDYLTTHTSLSPIRRGFRAQLCKLQKKVQSSLPVACRFYPGTPASSITKTGHHDIAEILLKVVLNTINQIKPNQFYYICIFIWHL